MARLPDFIVGGGMAAGTSFLSSLLEQNPAIQLPAEQRPEPNFFHYSWKYENGLDWYAQKWFATARDDQTVGERSSLYLTSTVAPDRIKAALPAVKVIFCLRNPVERAWAAYRFTALEGLETLQFIDALESEADRMAGETGIWAEVQPHAYLYRSCYCNHLRTWIELFGHENVLLVKSEDLGRRPGHWLKKICNFVGAPSAEKFTLPPNFTSPSVVDLGTQAALRNEFGDCFSELVECVRTLSPISEDLIEAAQLPQLQRLKDNLTSDKTPMPADARTFLSARLVPEIAALRDLVPFDIDDWG